MTADEQKGPKICLIGGTGRSGTSIFKRIFTDHPSATGIPEFRITVDPDGLVDFYVSLLSHWTPFLFDRKIRNLKQLLLDAAHSNSLSKYYRYGLKKTNLSKSFYKLESRYTDIGVERYCPGYTQLVHDLIDQLVQYKYKGSWTGQCFGEMTEINFTEYPDSQKIAEDLGNFYRNVVARTTEAEGTTHFIDDNTWNILYFPQLLDLLPTSRLVHIYRDPRDVTASYMKQSWAPSDPIQAAQFCRSILDRWNTVRNQLSDHTYLEISLEDLVDSPRKILNKVTAFWELEWDDSLLERDLSKSNRGRWKRDIPEETKGEIQEILKDHIKAYGYEFD